MQFNLFTPNNKSDKQSKLNKNILIRENRCPKNHLCPSVKVCPVGALSQQGFDAPTVNKDVCIKCGKCVKFCPMGVFVIE